MERSCSGVTDESRPGAPGLGRAVTQAHRRRTENPSSRSPRFCLYGVIARASCVGGSALQASRGSAAAGGTSTDERAIQAKQIREARCRRGAPATPYRDSPRAIEPVASSSRPPLASQFGSRESQHQSTDHEPDGNRERELPGPQISTGSPRSLTPFRIHHTPKAATPAPAAYNLLARLRRSSSIARVESIVAGIRMHGCVYRSLRRTSWENRAAGAKGVGKSDWGRIVFAGTAAVGGAQSVCGTPACEQAEAAPAGGGEASRSWPFMRREGAAARGSSRLAETDQCGANDHAEGDHENHVPPQTRVHVVDPEERD